MGGAAPTAPMPPAASKAGPPPPLPQFLASSPSPACPLPRCPPPAGTHSSLLLSSLWSTVRATGFPPGVSRMQRESPTAATVTVLPSTTTNVAVVPARRSARHPTQPLSGQHHTELGALRPLHE